MRTIPPIESMIEEALPRIHGGDCPCCGRVGPTDVHDAYWCRSMIVVTNSGRSTLLGCRRCGAAHQRRELLTTALFGWWGHRGLFLTPYQLARTLSALLLPPNPIVPSKKLREHVRALVTTERREKHLPRCPACQEPYDPDDYREDAERLLCSRCSGELPRDVRSARM